MKAHGEETFQELLHLRLGDVDGAAGAEDRGSVEAFVRWGDDTEDDWRVEVVSPVEEEADGG